MANKQYSLGKGSGYAVKCVNEPGTKNQSGQHANGERLL